MNNNINNNNVATQSSKNQFIAIGDGKEEQVNYDAAISLMSEEQFLAATSHLKKAIFYNPNSIQCYIQLGICYSSIFDLSQAILVFRKALQEITQQEQILIDGEIKTLEGPDAINQNSDSDINLNQQSNVEPSQSNSNNNKYNNFKKISLQGFQQKQRQLQEQKLRLNEMMNDCVLIKGLLTLEIEDSCAQFLIKTGFKEDVLNKAEKVGQQIQQQQEGQGQGGQILAQTHQLSKDSNSFYAGLNNVNAQSMSRQEGNDTIIEERSMEEETVDDKDKESKEREPSVVLLPINADEKAIETQRVPMLLVDDEVSKQASISESQSHSQLILQEQQKDHQLLNLTHSNSDQSIRQLEDSKSGILSHAQDQEVQQIQESHSALQNQSAGQIQQEEQQQNLGENASQLQIQEEQIQAKDAAMNQQAQSLDALVAETETQQSLAQAQSQQINSDQQSNLITVSDEQKEQQVDQSQQLQVPINNVSLQAVEMQLFQQKESNANYAFIEALCFLNLQYTKLALQKLNDCLSMDHTFVDALISKSKILRGMHQNLEANTIMWEVEKLDHSNPELVQFKSIVQPQIDELYKEAKIEMLKNGTSTKALQLVNEGLTLHPTQSELLLLRGFLLRRKENYEAALSDLELAYRTIQPGRAKGEEAEIRSQIGHTYNEMGMHLFKKKKFSEAKTIFTEALVFKPDDWGIILNRGDANKAMGLQEQSLQDYLQAFELAGRDEAVVQRIAAVFHSLAIVAFNQKQYTKALQIFTHAIEYHNNSFALYLSRGKCHLKLNNYYLAKADFQQAHKLDPANLEVQNFISQLCKSSGMAADSKDIKKGKLIPKHTI